MSRLFLTPKEQTVTCYDPMGTNCTKQVTLVKSFLTKQCSKSGGCVYQWRRVPRPDGIALQKDGVSCGVVTCVLPFHDGGLIFQSLGQTNKNHAISHHELK